MFPVVRRRAFCSSVLGQSLRAVRASGCVSLINSVSGAEKQKMTRGVLINWSWASAFIGAASVAATSALIRARPKDPTFELISIKLTSLKLNLPSIDVELIMTVQITNPNIAPIHYSSTEMSIFYSGSRLGSAQIDAGSQPRNSTRVLKLPARLSGLELANHMATFFGDVRRREMVLEAEVDIEGSAKVLWWDHKFRVHVNSHVIVDPLFLDVIDQENTAEMDLLLLGD